MANTRFLHTRVNNEQLIRIKQNASDAGYKTVSDFTRDRTLNTSTDIISKIVVLQDNDAIIIKHLDNIEKNLIEVISIVKEALEKK